MVIYRLQQNAAGDVNYMEYDMVEYQDNLSVTTERPDVNDVTDVASSCIHTATLAVCTVLVIFVLFLGCAGNGVVLFNALTTKRHRHASDLLVINLAGADFIMCTCLAPMFLFLLFSSSDIPRVFCASILFLGVTSGLLSLLSVVSIAIHRKCRVVGILRKSLSLSKVSMVVGVIWLFSVALAVGGTVHVSLTWTGEAINECRNVINTGHSGNFVLYYLSPITIASLILIGLCYGSIGHAARGQSRYGHLVSPETKPDSGNAVNCQLREHDNRQSAADKCASPSPNSSADNGNKAIIMCFVVTLTVSLCWGPLIMSQFVEIFTGETIILYQVKLCGIALIFLNSALNPYLYGQNNCRMKHKYIRALYNFARCEYTFPVRTADKRKPHHTAHEHWPLQGSPPTQEDTMSGPYTCPSCENSCADCRETEARHARQYATNIRYAQYLVAPIADNKDVPCDLV